MLIGVWFFLCPRVAGRIEMRLGNLLTVPIIGWSFHFDSKVIKSVGAFNE